MTRTSSAAARQDRHRGPTTRDARGWESCRHEDLDRHHHRSGPPEAVLDVLTDPDAVRRAGRRSRSTSRTRRPAPARRQPRARQRPARRPARRLRRRGPRGRRAAARARAPRPGRLRRRLRRSAAADGGSEVRASVSVRPAAASPAACSPRPPAPCCAPGALQRRRSARDRRRGLASPTPDPTHARRTPPPLLDHRPPTPVDARPAVAATAAHPPLRRRRVRRRRPARRLARGPRRPVHRRHGPVGLRQVDADAPARRPRPPDRGHRRASAARTSRACPTSSSPSCAASTSASSSSRSTCCRR